MSTESEPIVGNWYQDLDRGDKFEVVALDEDNGTVEIQYSDGDLDEIDLDAWHEMTLKSIESPEDWTGPMDMPDQDEASYAGPALEAWTDRPCGKSRRLQEAWEDEAEAEEYEDDWEEEDAEERPWWEED